MKILFCGNCQVDGLHYFMERALPKFKFRRLPHLATFYGEFSEEKIAEDHAWADLVFFHHKHDHPQNYPTKQPKVSLSVWFQSAPFMAQMQDEMFHPVIEYARENGVEKAIEYAVKEHDFDYQKRWDLCIERMKEKEENEEVPESIRISDLMHEYGKDVQLQLTCNHPSSRVFWAWTNKLCSFLNVEREGGVPFNQCVNHSNLAGLPCEESATSGAVKHLKLGWGGRPEDEESGRGIVRERLTRLM